MSATTTAPDTAPVPEAHELIPEGDHHEVTIWNKIGYWFPLIIAVGYSGVIGAAFSIQITQGDMPCPLCMLQRMGMVLVGIAALWMVGLARKGKLNLNMYMRCYGLMLLSAVLGAVIAARQVELHILPGDKGYGEPVLSLHLYTWAFITFCVVIIYSGIMLIFGRTFIPVVPRGNAAKWITRILVAIFIIIIAANVVSVFMEEGFTWVLPDDPIRYELPYQLGLKN